MQLFLVLLCFWALEKAEVYLVGQCRRKPSVSGGLLFGQPNCVLGFIVPSGGCCQAHHCLVPHKGNIANYAINERVICNRN